METLYNLFHLMKNLSLFFVFCFLFCVFCFVLCCFVFVFVIISIIIFGMMISTGL